MLLPASLPPLTHIPKPWCESGGSRVIVIVLTVNSCRLSGWGPIGDVCGCVWFCCVGVLRIAETLAGLDAGVLLSGGFLSVDRFPNIVLQINKMSSCHIWEDLNKNAITFLWTQKYVTFYNVIISKFCNFRGIIFVNKVLIWSS